MTSICSITGTRISFMHGMIVGMVLCKICSNDGVPAGVQLHADPIR